ncbi:MAG: PadR family transcriptional regulator [Solirubrobacterales bacterium]
MDLSPTAHVILGMLNLGPRSGYEIKARVEGSTRFFWAVSYGQIYPELRRLEAAGLIEGTSAPRGERKRTIYELTPEGRGELERWLRTPPRTFELRDEGLLKLFFSGAVEPADAARTLAAMREGHLATVEQLRAIEPDAAARGDGYPLRVLRFGVAYHEWVAAACEEMERELLDEPGRGGR